MEGGANSTYSSQYGGVVQSSAPLMEGLQSVLKQRDGEVQQLQWEIHRLQTERNFLSNEMSNLTIELEKVKRCAIYLRSSAMRDEILSGF